MKGSIGIFPQCEAVYNLNSGKLVLADVIRRKTASGLDRFIKYAVKARFFNVQGIEDSVVDTLGLSLLYIEDLQYHFHGMDPNWVVEHAYNIASYLLHNDNPIKDGDTIIDWNANNTYIQSEGINQDFGVFDSPDELLKIHRQEMSAFKNFLFRYVGRHLINLNVKRIRNRLI